MTMETASPSAPAGLSAGALIRALHGIAFRLAGREELAVRLRAAWEHAREVIACDHCLVMLWPERDLLALCEPDCPEAGSDRLRQRLEWHARMLDEDIAASIQERPRPSEPQDAISLESGLKATASTIPP